MGTHSLFAGNLEQPHFAEGILHTKHSHVVIKIIRVIFSLYEINQSHKKKEGCYGWSGKNQSQLVLCSLFLTDRLFCWSPRSMKLVTIVCNHVCRYTIGDKDRAPYLHSLVKNPDKEKCACMLWAAGQWQ